MLVYASRLLGMKVLSLQVGGPIAQITGLVIDPDKLQIIACRLDGPTINDANNILDMRSVREFSQLGFIIDDADELVAQSDVIKIDQVMQLNFHLTGLKAVTKKGTRLGKITDFSVDPGSLLVQQLVVKRPALRSLLDPELVIHRRQIVAVDDYKVTVKSDTEKAPAPTANAENFVPNFVNPFRKTEQPAEATEATTGDPSSHA